MAIDPNKITLVAEVGRRLTLNELDNNFNEMRELEQEWISAIAIRDESVAAKDVSVASKDRAVLAETNSLESENNSATSELNAAQSDSNAQEWAVKQEDIPVSVVAGGNGVTDFSSLHWAAKSEASRLLSLQYSQESFDSAQAAAQSEDDALIHANRSEVEADRAQGYADSLQPSTFLKKNENLLGITNPSVARNNLELGTAAIENITESKTDRTQGRVLRVGDFGVGGESFVDNQLNANSIEAGEVRSWTNITQTNAINLNLPSIGGAGTLTVNWLLVCQGTSTRLVQKATEIGGVGTFKGRTFIRVKTGVDWNPWIEVTNFNVASVDKPNLFDRIQTISLNTSSPVYNNGHLLLQSEDGSGVSMGFHRGGFTACQLRHDGNGLILSGSSRTNAANFQITGTFFGNGAGLTNLDMSKVLGEVQNWVDVTNSRQFGINYTNTTGRSIYVVVQGSGAPNNGTIVAYCDGIFLGEQGVRTVASAAMRCLISFVVPNGSTYRVQSGAGANLSRWSELR